MHRTQSSLMNGQTTDQQQLLQSNTTTYMIQRTAPSWPRITAHTPDSFRAMSFTVAYSVPKTYRTPKEEDANVTINVM
jgi:hypothetical protein